MHQVRVRVSTRCAVDVFGEEWRTLSRFIVLPEAAFEGNRSPLGKMVPCRLVRPSGIEPGRYMSDP